MITQEYLKEILDYDPQTGIFRWREKLSIRAPIGTVAGYENESGYILIMIAGKNYRAHRLAWLYTYGEWPKLNLDHRDMDRKNNRLENLREATRTQNLFNSKTRKNSSGIRGVWWEARRGQWRARINFEGRERHLGYFDTIEMAVAARKQKVAELAGEFARD